MERTTELGGGKVISKLGILLGDEVQILIHPMVCLGVAVDVVQVRVHEGDKPGEIALFSVEDLSKRHLLERFFCRQVLTPFALIAIASTLTHNNTT